MKEKGLRLQIDGQELTAHPQVTDDPAKAGPQDCVIVTLKAHSVAPVAKAMQPLLGPETAVVTAMNGMPWWYFYTPIPGRMPDHQLQSLDPDGSLWRLIPPRALHRLRGLSGRLGGGARRGEALSTATASCSASPTAATSARATAAVGRADRGRLQGAGAAAHPRRHLGQAVGQSQLQSGQRAHRRHAGRDRHRSRHARGRSAG